MSGKRSYTGLSLEKALRDGTFERAAIQLTGMVKASDKADHIGFARGDCETWIDLPTELIDGAEHLGQRTCSDHMHPVFNITLTEPKDGVAQVLSSLLKAPMPTPTGTGPIPVEGWQGDAVARSSPMLEAQAGGLGLIPLPFGCGIYCFTDPYGRTICRFTCTDPRIMLQ